MILPTKRVKHEHSLIFIGSVVLSILEESKTVSRLWDDFKKLQTQAEFAITFDWFMLALDFLYMLGTIEYSNGLLRKLQYVQPNL